jgi:threonine dehydratase
MLTLERVYQAAHQLKNVIRETDMIPASNIKTNCNLFLKTENLQNTGSFKLRGAYFEMSQMSPEERAKGVVACSAGNHAQGVGFAARALGISATIFLPSTAPISKVEATRQYGADIKLVDGVYDDAYNEAVAWQKQTGAAFVHPFNDEDVIAGQGTIGLEILQQLPDLDAVVVPVGGGGLISGIAYVIKKLKPTCKVYGVQAEGACSMSNAMEKNQHCGLAAVSTFADGIAVKCPGELTFDMCQKYVDQVITVSDNEIATGILTLMEQQKLVAEGAGAVSVAAVLFNKLPLEGKKVCAIVSGGNIDVNILSRVINRGLETSGRLSEVTIELLDKPGQLRDVADIIAKTGANVTKVSHKVGGENTDINGCYLHVSMETRNHAHLKEIEAAFNKAGYKLIHKP